MPSVRRRNTPARCPPPMAGRRSFSSATSGIASRSMPISPDKGKTTRSSRIARAFASIWKTCATRTFATAPRNLAGSALARSGASAAKVTRDIAERLAQVSKALEAKKYPAQDVAMFLMRCLFTMFAEDVKLLPENSFKRTPGGLRANPEVRARCRPALGGDESGDVRLRDSQAQGKAIQWRVLPDARCCRSAARRSANLRRPRTRTGRKSSPQFSVRCSNRRSIRRAATARRALHAARLRRAAGRRDDHRTLARGLAQRAGDCGNQTRLRRQNGAAEP